jgi:hypothetical protein
VLHIPILRHGAPYESAEQVELRHHATGRPVARVSMANSGLIARDVARMDSAALERLSTSDLLEKFRRAARHFIADALPLGDPRGPRQTFEDYVGQLSATTGMPVTYCRNNAAKIESVLSNMTTVLSGLTRGLDPALLDRGYGLHQGRMVSFVCQARHLGAVLPSNSPGVHSLWLPAVALKTSLVLKPGREEPWTPLRVIESFLAAGLPRAAFGFYPSDHAGAAEILRLTDRAMLFGDASTTRPWADDPRIELHGPGFSKVLLGEDEADSWAAHLDVMASSIAANSGRSCINASAVWTPRHGRAIAQALSERLGRVRALPADDPRAELALFADPGVAQRISDAIGAGLREPGAVDVTQQLRGLPRLACVRSPGGGEAACLLPTIIACDAPAHPLANREFLFPYAAVVECPAEEMPEAIGRTLVVSAITRDPRFSERLTRCRDIDRLNLGAIPTWQLAWDQPHEGNLFDLLYRRRAFQQEPAA